MHSSIPWNTARGKATSPNYPPHQKNCQAHLLANGRGPAVSAVKAVPQVTHIARLNPANTYLSDQKYRRYC